MACRRVQSQSAAAVLAADPARESRPVPDRRAARSGRMPLETFLRTANAGRDAAHPADRSRADRRRAAGGGRTSRDSKPFAAAASGREFALTYRDGLEANETLVTAAAVEAGCRRRAGSVGRARAVRRAAPRTRRRHPVRRSRPRRSRRTITSVREVEWGDSRSGGFMFVLNPAALAGAPGTFIAALQASSDRRRAPGCSAISSRASRTSRPSTCGRSCRRSRACSTTLRSPSPWSVRSRR